VSDEILSTRRGSVGQILINRPRALNALTGPMFAEIGRILDRWGSDDGIEAVVVRGEGSAFSAGGDIRFVRDMVTAGDGAGIATMYADEYRLDAQIDAFPKPYVAAVDGYCMGGGLGVAMYADVVAVTERALVAMPEVGIGFFPDVGTSHVLPRLPDRIGWYMGLTGARLSAADAIACGLATHLVDEATFARIEELVDDDTSLDALVALLESKPDPVAPIDALRPAISRCFDQPDLRSVLGALEREDGAWAAESLAAMRKASPTSLAITFELFRRGSTLTLAECLEMEYQLAVRVCRTPEFLEGVRAMVVDKDRTPRWNPGAVEQLQPNALEALWSEIDVTRDELRLGAAGGR
jgi:enoyl-CoA hydratase